MIGVSSVIDNNEGAVPNFGDQYLFKGDYQGTRGGNAYGIYCEGDKHYFDGNVGIGTASPENKLHVQQSALYTGIQTEAGIRIKSDGASSIGNYHGYGVFYTPISYRR
jgi:hypothetical protein